MQLSDFVVQIILVQAVVYVYVFFVKYTVEDVCIMIQSFCFIGNFDVVQEQGEKYLGQFMTNFSI